MAEFFVYYIKNSGEGGKFFCLLHEKQGEGGIIFWKLISGYTLLFETLQSYESILINKVKKKSYLSSSANSNIIDLLLLSLTHKNLKLDGASSGPKNSLKQHTKPFLSSKLLILCKYLEVSKTTILAVLNKLSLDVPQAFINQRCQQARI